MRKLILGIIAVVCVQFAFVMYMQLQSPLELAAAPDQPEFPIVNADLSWVRELDRYAVDLPDPKADHNASETHRNGASASSSEVAGNDRPGRSETVRKLRPRIERPAIKDSRFFSPDNERLNPVEFETVVISYNRDSEPSPCDRPNVTRSKKRWPITYVANTVNSRWQLIRSDLPKLY